MFELEDKKTSEPSAGSSSDLSRLNPTFNKNEDPYPVSLPVFTPVKRQRSLNWRILRALSRALLSSSFAFIGLGYHYKGKLPTPSEISPALLSNPVQTQTSREPFTFKYRTHSYSVTPQAEYEIAGVVVTHNNISGIGDAYHTSDSVDMKDLCVVWGSNVKTGAYRELKYESEPWRCVVSSDEESAWNRFFMDELSNNHLLASDEGVQKSIRAARVGDQVRLKGMLVDYSPADAPSLVRKTSLVRTDTGNGACEVMFVESFEILKRATPKWYSLYTAGWWLLGITFFLRGYIFLREPYGKLQN